MAADISSSPNHFSTDELRLRHYRMQLEQKQQMEIHNLQEKHAEVVKRLAEGYQNQEQELKNAYEIEISKEAESLEGKLHQIRLNHNERANEEKQAGEEDLTKIKTACQKRVEEYKKTSEAQLSSLHKQFQTSETNLINQAKKNTRKEQEVPKK